MLVTYFSALGLFLVSPEKLHTLKCRSKGTVGERADEWITQVPLLWRKCERHFFHSIVACSVKTCGVFGGKSVNVVTLATQAKSFAVVVRCGTGEEAGSEEEKIPEKLLPSQSTAGLLSSLALELLSLVQINRKGVGCKRYSQPG